MKRKLGVLRSDINLYRYTSVYERGYLLVKINVRVLNTGLTNKHVK